MNFVMYGGSSLGTKRVASGHTVFPTHMHDQKRYGGHGYLTHDAHQLTLSGVAIMEKKEQIPGLISDQLDRIEGSQAGSDNTGSVVIIPGFNRFPDNNGEPTKDCCALICEDIAKHFFVAVAQQRLQVSVTDCTENPGGGDSAVCPIKTT